MLGAAPPKEIGVADGLQQDPTQLRMKPFPFRPYDDSLAPMAGSPLGAGTHNQTGGPPLFPYCMHTSFLACVMGV